nr:PREDICTED: UPF0454 protein C12orf49 homolog [Linepithema humile]XP_012235944.1 PREDICTED: UPF0454 protein C12orf49 homolog [Linepithema humile]XP_012235945.1 PREDICTED: UPF0454 protein C12orf49 homolog [Linepithema humile]XP_012235946.1 PREDICTED: UPF0454 protein C12orf49 homolog [Linepithema humile]XP_012235947.1 PREDICTED: UPF0454 protein C12orf49 homolog [Linepithema humile]XP_012235948.1 PREDICTED: UPF0454 protein C12orf49 homolog [Linepithema humile]XP_012235949.1 PREDICTED: UPF0454 p
MPSCAGLIRLIRRRFVLALIFALSLTYCIFSLIRNEKKTSLNLNSNLEDIMDHMMINDNKEDLIPDDNMLEELKASDKWQMDILDSAVNDNTGNMDIFNESDASIQLCRNSIQGKGLIVDERGLVCSRREVLPNGCCKIEQKQIAKKEQALSVVKRERYSCKTCNPQGCCMIYEYCVSCCLHPDKQIRGRKNILLGFTKAQRNEEKTHIRNSDRFQICLAICRTSSSSVQHENIYKDPHAKHCYTSNSQRHQRNINSLNNNGENPAVIVTFSFVVALFIHFSPEISYHSLNESHIPCYVNVISPNCMLTLHHNFEIHIE